jgi:hypothetical protein
MGTVHCRRNFATMGAPTYSERAPPSSWTVAAYGGVREVIGMRCEAVRPWHWPYLRTALPDFCRA